MGAPRNGDEAAATNRISTSDFGSQRTETEVPETSRSENASRRGRKRTPEAFKRTSRGSGTQTSKVKSFEGSGGSRQNQ